MKGKLFTAGAALFFVAGIVFWGGFNTAMEATNTLEFCISCHEMESTVYQEYRHSVHFRNSSGVQAACPDCHVPREWIHKVIRKIQASVEVYHWAVGSIDTPEKFEAKRAVLAGKVWKTMKNTDSRECRNCHRFDSMELKQQSYFARSRHGSGLEKGMTCIDCHKGISHHLPKPKTVAAAPSAEELEYGEEINETCAGCHGEYAQGKSDGEYPRLAGLPKDYIIKQLRDFKSRHRINIPMFPYTTERELPEEDVQAVAAYLASRKLPSKLPPARKGKEFNALARLHESSLVVNIPRLEGDVAKGEYLYQHQCSACHGRDGYGKPGLVIPPLAGQHSGYLKRQIRKFARGERLHADEPGDAEGFRDLSPTQVQNLLAYLATLDDN
ncbi:MAG TPA: c-type cytochrome [Gammaproteobacteria bacterium]|nr:c-type cytochrome [Gammaproteobacteria bacterium]